MISDVPESRGRFSKRLLLNLSRLEGHLITNQPQSHIILCNIIIVTETIETLLGDFTIAKMNNSWFYVFV